MVTPANIYRRKGTRVIYPWTEANAKNPNLIAMTVAEAQEEGLLAPRVESEASFETERNNALAEENAALMLRIKKLEAMQDEPPKKVTKKKVAKKIEVEKGEPIPEPMTSNIAELGL